MKEVLMEITGKKVLVTGAASGIGRATALEMARSGAGLFMTDINGPGLEETFSMVSREGGEAILARPLDIGDYGQVRSFASEVYDRAGPIDILINVAGVALISQLEDLAHEDWEKVVNVNLWGPVHGIECFVPEMIRAGRGGHIVTVSSTAGIIGLPWHAAYAATKHALLGISEVLRFDLRKHGIGVTVVCPGAVRTNLVATSDVRAEKDAIRKLKERFLKAAIPPERVAGLIADAIRRDRFLVITSADIKALYFLKRHFPPVYTLAMQLMTSYLDRTLIGGTTKGKAVRAG
jgi:NAD(P)-dependent dehydrogenase (short-subunit alcohol dehydrogenase family)